MIDQNTYKIFFDNSLDGMLLIENEHFIQCNDVAVKMLGYESSKHFLQKHSSYISLATPPDGSSLEHKIIHEMINIALKTGQNRFDWLHWKADGSRIWIDVSLTHVMTEKRQVIHVVWHDIDAMKLAEERLLQSKQQVDDFINKLPVAIARYETNNMTIGYFNQKFQELFGWNSKDISIIDEWFLNAYPDEQYREKIISIWEDLIAKTHELNLDTSPFPMEARIRCKDNSVKYCKVWYHSNVGNVFGIFHDITKQKEAEQQLIEKNIELKKLSQQDGLTGLLNRVSIEMLIQSEMSRADRYNQDFISIIMFDLDHFKNVNDNYGHAEGDLVLRTVAKLVEDCKRTSDQVGRWGGEEFMILCPNTNLKGAMKHAEKLRKLIEYQDFELSGRITSSFGVATCLSGETVNQFCNRVDERLYEAKTSGRNRVVGYPKN